jgi:hypothetical protein
MARNISLSVPHQLTRAEAKRRIEEGIAQYLQQYGRQLGHIDRNWQGDAMSFSATTMGMSVTGSLCVEDQVVRVEIAVPWLLARLVEGAKPMIEQQGRKLLSSQ